MTSLASLLAGAVPRDGGMHLTLPPDWMQGRTAYGGLSTALALAAAQGLADDLPPLRSAQIAFIGPLSGQVDVRPMLLRRGRNAAFIQSDVTGGSGLGLRATFVFMAPLASAIAQDTTPPAPAPRPAADAEVQVGPPGFFTHQFEAVDPGIALSPAEWLRWVRLRDRHGLDAAIELMAIGDALPPAALRLIGGHRPLSSLTWTINLLDPAPMTDDGWWLLSARADRALDGYSSQAMRVWNSEGRLVAEAMQGVAIFA